MTNEDDDVYRFLAPVCLEVLPEIAWWSCAYVSALKLIQEPLHKKEKDSSTWKGSIGHTDADLIILFNFDVNATFGENNTFLLLLLIYYD